MEQIQTELLVALQEIEGKVSQAKPLERDDILTIVVSIMAEVSENKNL